MLAPLPRMRITEQGHNTTMATPERGTFAIPGSKSDVAAADGDYVPKNIFLTGGAGEFRLFCCSTSCATFQFFFSPPRHMHAAADTTGIALHM